MQTNPLLTLANIAKCYTTPGADGVVVLRDVSLCVAPGETLAVTGPSGSGKSTLLNIMGGLDRPTHGTVTLEGHDLTALDERALARLRNESIGFVFQLHHLLPQCTVLENVLIPTIPAHGDRTAATARARHLLERVGLSTRMHHRPAALSGGERQRTAVVRALVNQPALLLADEPTGSLDHAAAESLSDLLVELNRDEAVALVVVTHSDALAARMHRRYDLRDGTLRAERPSP